MSFSSFGLHKAIENGLKKGGYITPTEVQKKIIPLAGKKGNIVCSAKTGSGKTLAFLVPVLERLMRLKWSRAEGLGAVIIAPTRELSLQIFEVLTSVGRECNLSGGLLIGGRYIEKEKGVVGMLNIVVGTPGRLLEHFESGWDFNGDNIEMLVIDEADKLMEMGFKETIEKILTYVSRKRQTLLFSATAEGIAKAKRVWDIDSPEYIVVSEERKEEVKMKQEAYWITAEKKFDLLYEIIKKNQKKKIIVFLSTCKEVTFFHDLYKRLRFGMALLRLSGNMSQNKRVDTYHKFCADEPRMLLCTDIAARGLDFPAVDIVVQLDAPESAETYIHRAGRTARNGAKGRVILALLEREKALLPHLQKVEGFPEVHRYKGKRSIAERVQAEIRKDPELYMAAQKYVKTYKGFLRVSKIGEDQQETDKCINELVEYLGVAENENVYWSRDAKQKSKMLNTRIDFD